MPPAKVPDLSFQVIGHTHATLSLLPIALRLDCVSKLFAERASMSTVSIIVAIWLNNYSFSSAVRAANSSLVYNVIVNACSARYG